MSRPACLPSRGSDQFRVGLSARKNPGDLQRSVPADPDLVHQRKEEVPTPLLVKAGQAPSRLSTPALDGLRPALLEAALGDRVGLGALQCFVEARAFRG